MTINWLLGWWNLVFLVPFALALLYLALYLLTGVTFGDADADVDADVDVDVDADVEADVDVDADADVETDADVDADSDADAEHGVHHAHGSGPRGLVGPLAWVGVGRVPLSLLLMILLLTWGFIGFVANQALRERMSRPSLMPLVSIPLATVGSIVLTGCAARVIGRLMPTEETYAKRRSELLGEVGEAIYAIDERFGMAAVRDERGNLYQVPCRVEPAHPPIAKGAKVLLVSYDANRNIYHVMPDDAGAFARDRRRRVGSGLTKGGLS